MENFLTDCLVCCEYLQNPQKLPCDHTFCGECLKKLRTSSDTIKCPTCRQTCNYKNVKADFKHAQFLELLKAKTSADTAQKKVESKAAKPEVRDCPMCEENEAVHWCETCQQIMCRICAKVHEKLAKEHTAGSTARKSQELSASDVTAAAVVAEQLLQLEAKNSRDSQEKQLQREQLKQECDVIERQLENFNSKIEELGLESAEQHKQLDDTLQQLRTKKSQILESLDEIFRAKETEIKSVYDKLGLDQKVENASLNYELVKAQLESIKQLNGVDPERALKSLEEIKKELERKTQLAAYETVKFTLEFKNDSDLSESVSLETKIQKHCADITANDLLEASICSWERNSEVSLGHVESMRCIDDLIWCCLGHGKRIEVREPRDLKVKRTIRVRCVGNDFLCVSDVALRDAKQVYVATYEGLIVLSKTGAFNRRVSLIGSSHVTCIASREQRLFASTFEALFVFNIERKPEGETLWRRIEQPNHCQWCTLSVRLNKIRVCTDNKVLVYSMNGDKVQEHLLKGMSEQYVFICDDDEEGAMLFSNFDTNSLHVMTPDGKLRDVTLAEPITGPLSACFLCGHLFVYSETDCKLVKFK